MKIIRTILTPMAAIACLYSCELDNYDAPGSCISGTVIDAGTGEPMPLPVEGSTGAVISLMEVGTGATLAQSFYAKQDGTFRNSMIFDGKYTVTADGPFTCTDKYEVTVKGEAELDIFATPYSRIEITVTQDGASATVNYSVTPVNDKNPVTRTFVMWNYRLQTDIQTGNYANMRTDNTGGLSGSVTFNFLNETQYNSNVEKIRANKGRIYLRAAAECGGEVNYSKPIEIIVL